MDENKSPLCDITNKQKLSKVSCRKRLVDGTPKQYTYDRKIRKSLEFFFDTSEQRDEFHKKYEQAKKSLNVKSNTDLLNRLLDIHSNYQRTPDIIQSSETSQDEPMCTLKTESKVNIDPNEMFICTYSQIQEILRFHDKYQKINIINFEKCGHVARMTLLSGDLYQRYLFWSSSPNLHGDYFVNHKMFHAYMCSGILQVQYERFSDFAGIGLPSKRLRLKMAETYGDSVNYLRDVSINDAIREEVSKTVPLVNGNVAVNNKLVVMTDARHACRKKSHNSDITTLGQISHKVVSYQYVTKRLERSSQKHEFFGTKRIYVDLESKNISVRIHSHDRNSSVSAFLDRDKPQVIDSYDTWHASKEVKKTITKVAKGPKRDHGIKWHTELADKTAGVKTHTYWAMKNCEGSILRFKSSLDNIVNHYQNKHEGCHPTSRCKTEPHYTLSRTMIRSDIAAQLLKKAIQSLYMYKHPEKYIHCLNTHYIESFHNTLLLYVDKRIHYGEKTYEIRTGIGILDWNEHVDRPTSSEKVFRRVRQTRNIAPERVLKPKTYSFVQTLWDIYCNFLTRGNRDNVGQENNIVNDEENVLRDSDESENEQSDCDE